VVATVVAAFAADPAYRYFFPDDDTYAGEASAFTGALFDARVELGTVWVEPEIASVSMWVPPTRNGATTSAPFPVSEAARARLGTYGEAVDPWIPAEPHWYLGILATHPDHAGHRLGRRLIEPGLRRAAADGLIAVLETTNPGNVELYERAGWQVRADIPDGPLPIWVLEHGP
ncbi:MAG TPA: GNAT family N-acetyltransferase, partial [Microthrixaceae bacterium]|nr:GNAT family N-acetyltransferase [Microthrixaceae bacterium]